MILNIIIAILVIAGIVLTAISLPGYWLVWIAILIHSINDSFSSLPLWAVVIFLLFTVFIGVIDNIAVALGSKKFGGSWWGAVGAVVGGIIGMIILNLPGLIIGSFLFAVLLEIIFEKKELSVAVKSGFGAVLGFFSGIVFKTVFTLIMVTIWLVIVW